MDNSLGLAILLWMVVNIVHASGEQNREDWPISKRNLYTSDGSTQLRKEKELERQDDDARRNGDAKDRPVRSFLDHSVPLSLGSSSAFLPLMMSQPMDYGEVEQGKTGQDPFASFMSSSGRNQQFLRAPEERQRMMLHSMGFPMSAKAFLSGRWYYPGIGYFMRGGRKDSNFIRFGRNGGNSFAWDVDPNDTQESDSDEMNFRTPSNAYFATKKNNFIRLGRSDPSKNNFIRLGRSYSPPLVSERH